MTLPLLRQASSVQSAGTKAVDPWCYSQGKDHWALINGGRGGCVDEEGRWRQRRLTGPNSPALEQEAVHNKTVLGAPYKWRYKNRLIQSSCHGYRRLCCRWHLSWKISHRGVARWRRRFSLAQGFQ